MGLQFTKHPKYYIFFETSGKIQFNEDDTNHHDLHQEPQDDGGCPPSMVMFLTTIYNFHPKYYIFFETSGKIKFNEDDPKHHDHYQEPQEDGGRPLSKGRFLTTIFHLTP